MSRPACANPANLLHRVTTDTDGAPYCHRECICGEYIEVTPRETCGGEHPAHPEGCTCKPEPEEE